MFHTHKGITRRTPFKQQKNSHFDLLFHCIKKTCVNKSEKKNNHIKCIQGKINNNVNIKTMQASENRTMNVIYLIKSIQKKKKQQKKEKTDNSSKVYVFSFAPTHKDLQITKSIE